MTVIFEPAHAIAAGICLTARTIAEGRTDRHPRPCGWCDWPLEDLRRMVDGFEQWAERDPKTGVPRRFEVVSFQSMPQRLQAEQILEAQAFPVLEQPTAAAVAVPAHDPNEEGPIWRT